MPSKTTPRVDVALPSSAIGKLAVGDAYGRGLSERSRGESQADYIIAVTDDRLAYGELAPWSPLIWRSHKMRRVVGSTLAAETQRSLNGLGHAEWIAAHFAEARFPDFDVAQRSAVLQHFRVVVRSPGLSVISVQCGRQTLWVRFGHC